MSNYLAPILRTQFNLFYRFGYSFIPPAHLVEFDGTITDNVIRKIGEVFKSITPFEYDEEYLILHFRANENIGDVNPLFRIKDIVSIYPLSLQAKSSIESKIDQRIKLEQPVFDSALPIIERNIQEGEIMNGIEALWFICNLDGDKDEIIKSIGINNILQGIEYRKSGIKASNIPEANYWSLLIAYDRIDYFPNSTLGYFYDSGQIFAYSKGHSSFEGSGLHQFLQSINSSNPQIKLRSIADSLETDPTVKSYINQSKEGTINRYLVAPIYFMLKEELRNSENIEQTNLIRHTDKFLIYGNDFKAAVVVLAAFFGYKRFYDAYYDKLDLSFYKSSGNGPLKAKEIPVSASKALDQLRENIRRKNADETKPSDVLVSNDADNSVKLIGDQEPDVKSGLQENQMNRFQQIILSIVKNNNEIKFADLRDQFNKTTKKKFKNDDLLSLMQEMSHFVDILYKGKRPDKAKLRAPL